MAVLLVAAFLLAGCGSDETLTNEQVEAMSDEEALSMVDCQMQKATEDLGQREAVDRYADALIGGTEEDGDILPVILWNDGYRCPEYLP